MMLLLRRPGPIEKEQRRQMIVSAGRQLLDGVVDRDAPESRFPLYEKNKETKAGLEGRPRENGSQPNPEHSFRPAGLLL